MLYLNLLQAKKRQVYLEETYGGSIRELELLLNTFQMDSNGEIKKKTTSEYSLICVVKSASYNEEVNFYIHDVLCLSYF